MFTISLLLLLKYFGIEKLVLRYEIYFFAYADDDMKYKQYIQNVTIQI